ncbi:MAG TPA: extracellular solute-binding protein [Chloroflexota bacterium]|nr:extracellular solute-binding protein [Chloroflexota bacterium]
MRQPMPSRRTFLRGAGLAAAAAALTACGQTAPTQAPAAPTQASAAPPPAAAATGVPASAQAPTSAPAAAAQAPAAAKPAAGGPAVTLKALYWSAGPEDHQVFVDTFNGFEKLYPTIKIDFDDTPSDQFVQKATTMFAAGLPPDAMKTHAAWVEGFITAKRFNDLTDRMKDVKAQYIQAQLDFWSLADHVYAAPYYSGPSFIFYNKTLFNKMGVKTPDDHLKAGTWTWQTLRELARATTGGSGADKTFGWDAAMQADNLQFYACVPIWDDQGEIVNKDNTAWLIDSDVVVDVYQWHADMYLKEKSIPLPADMQGINYFMKTGRLAMAWAGKFRANDLINMPFEVGMVGTPKGKVGPINRDGPNGTALPVGTKNVDQAYQLALYLGGEQAAPYYLGGGASIPVKKTLLDSPDFKKGLKPFEKPEVYAESAATVRAWRVPGKGAEAGRVFTAEWQKVLVGQQDVPTMMKNAKPQMDALLK